MIKKTQSHFKKTFLSFSLIEILIVISVFSVWIITILKALLSNLFLMDELKLKTQWIILAKEWIDIIYNIKDSNKKKWLERNCILNVKWLSNNIYKSNICSDHFTTNKKFVYNVWISTGNYINIKKNIYSDNFYKNFENNVLSYIQYSWLNIIWIYNNKNINNTNFARYIIFSPIIESWYIINTWKIVKITSIVLIKKWAYTWKVEIESFIWNY